jgi:hypothetical protein
MSKRGYGATLYNAKYMSHAAVAAGNMQGHLLLLLLTLQAPKPLPASTALGSAVVHAVCVGENAAKTAKPQRDA